MWPYLACAVAVIAIGMGIWIWRRKRQQQSGRMLSFVALLREPQSLEALYIQTAARKAWNAELGIGEEPGPDGFVLGEELSYVIQYRERSILLNNFPSPYMEDPEEAAESIADLRLQGLVASHTAWMSCDALGFESADGPEEMHEWYRVLGKLLAELIDDNCLAIYLPDTDQIFAANEETLELLRSDDPFSAIYSDGGEVPVIHVPDDHPKMMKAVEEAKRRWPEFVAAFESGTPKNASVKAPISRGDNCEFIWVEVTAIENNMILGKLGNEPMNLPGLKIGSRVRTTVDEVNDWAYIDENGEFVGGFTVKVLMELAEQSPKQKRKG